MPLDIGLIGATAVAERAMVHPSARYDDTAIRAVAASDRERAAAFATRHDIGMVHRDYAALIEDPMINTVYISLHNSAHHEWATRAARAGKHVIVEKPLCLNDGEFTSISAAAAATGVRVVEAIATQGHEWQAAVRELTTVGRYGRLTSMRTRIQFATPQGAGYRLRPELGGGIFFDAASYWLQAVQAVCSLGDATGYGRADYAGPSGVDVAFHAGFDWPNGLQSVFDCSFGAGHVAEHEFRFDEAIARLRHFLLPMAGPAPLNLVVLGSDGRTVRSFAPVAYYDDQFGRIRELLTKETADRECESATAERIRFMASVYADAGRQFGGKPR